jgi:16S rRNA (guanine966-N2)-methyltransferase
MRIVAGSWRGRTLTAPPGSQTRPTADRVRQALFDMLLHAPWGGRATVEGAQVLDVFAGSGALGLEALSRGAAHASFIERDGTALAALRANIAALRAERLCTVLSVDALAVPARQKCELIFLDPPYGGDILPPALARLRATGWIAPGALIVAETARDEPSPSTSLLAERIHGAARISVWREVYISDDSAPLQHGASGQTNRRSTHHTSHPFRKTRFQSP